MPTYDLISLSRLIKGETGRRRRSRSSELITPRGEGADAQSSAWFQSSQVCDVTLFFTHGYFMSVCQHYCEGLKGEGRNLWSSSHLLQNLLTGVRILDMNLKT